MPQTTARTSFHPQVDEVRWREVRERPWSVRERATPLPADQAREPIRCSRGGLDGAVTFYDLTPAGAAIVEELIVH